MSTLGLPSNAITPTRKFGVKGHTGTDWPWGKGRGVCAMADGVVTEVRTLSDYGRIVRVLYDAKIDGRTASERSCHLAEQSVGVGERVKRGQDIGVMGNTGSLIPIVNGAKAVHLHSELWLGGARVDEEPYQHDGLAPSGGGETPITPTEEPIDMQYQYVTHKDAKGDEWALIHPVLIPGGIFRTRDLAVANGFAPFSGDGGEFLSEERWAAAVAAAKQFSELAIAQLKSVSAGGGGSGLTSEEHTKLLSIPTAPETAAEVIRQQKLPGN